MLQSIVLPRVDLKQIQKLAGQIPLGLGAGESFSVTLSALWDQGGLFSSFLWAHLSGLCVQVTALGIILPFTWSITYICSWVIFATHFLSVESLNSHSFPSFCLCPLQSRLAVFLLIWHSQKPLLVFSVYQGNPCYYTRGFSTDPSCITHMSIPGFCWGGWLDLKVTWLISSTTVCPATYTLASLSRVYVLSEHAENFSNHWVFVPFCLTALSSISLFPLMSYCKQQEIRSYFPFFFLEISWTKYPDSLFTISTFHLTIKHSSANFSATL